MNISIKEDIHITYSYMSAIYSISLHTTIILTAEKMNVLGPIFNFKLFQIIVYVFIPKPQVHPLSKR